MISLTRLFIPMRTQLADISLPKSERIQSLSLYLPYTPIKGYTMKDINRIKVVLVEQKKTGKWLAEQLGKDPSTVSKWCSNKMQPSLEMLMQIAEKLDVDVRNLIVTTK